MNKKSKNENVCPGCGEPLNAQGLCERMEAFRNYGKNYPETTVNKLWKMINNKF